MFRPTVFRVVLALFAFSALATAADAGLLVDFKADPVSSTMYEIGWTVAGGFVPRSGSLGNGDGALPSDQQTPGGLNIQTPQHIVGVTGSTHNLSDGSTTFYDVTLQLTGLGANGSAQMMWGLVYQPLNTGTFTLLSTNKDELGNLISPTVLLTGTIDGAYFVGSLGYTTGSIQSGNVMFTDGMINGGSSPGTLSWSLSDIGGGLSVNSGLLASFDANMTGLLTPEPATLCLMGVGVVATLISRRKR